MPDERQSEALLTIMSGQAGGALLFEIVAEACPNVHEPIASRHAAAVCERMRYR